MATVSLKLNEVYKDKNDKSQVVFLIRNKKSHAHIPSGIKTTKTWWDEIQWIKRGCPDVTDHNHANAQLLKKKGQLNDLFYDLTQSGEIDDLTAAQIKDRFLQKEVNLKYNFTTYFEYVMNSKKPGTRTFYMHTFTSLAKFRKGELAFSDVNARFLRDFEAWYGQTVNGVGIHFRNIRHVFNRAIDDEIIDLNQYPFRRFKIKKEETKKRNINIEKTRRLRDVELSGVPGLARDVYMLMFYMIGINLKDLVYLPKEVLVDNTVDYRRMKTRKNYYIELCPEALKLIKKLAGTKYLICLAERYQNYDAIKKEINKKLKVAATTAGISERISTYWSRHSWATYAHNLDIPEETISLALGHSTGHKTTGIYIERNVAKISKANKQVVHLLNMGPFQKV